MGLTAARAVDVTVGVRWCGYSVAARRGVLGLRVCGNLPQPPPALPRYDRVPDCTASQTYWHSLGRYTSTLLMMDAIYDSSYRC